MKDLKNILKLICIVAYPVAVVGGIGYCIYYRQYVVVASIFFLGVMAWPAWRKLFPEKQKPPEE